MKDVCSRDEDTACKALAVLPVQLGMLHLHVDGRHCRAYKKLSRCIWKCPTDHHRDEEVISERKRRDEFVSLSDNPNYDRG